MTSWIRYAIVAVIVLGWPGWTAADLRMQYDDATLVQRSELIVVARIEKDSVVYVPHVRSDGSAVGSWEYHATLAVSEVLKGSIAKQKAIPIVIHYGLDVTVGGRRLTPGRERRGAPPDQPIPPERIDIFDTSNSVMQLGAILENIQQNHLWFLRHLRGEKEGQVEFGIRDPEDMQDLKFKGYFQGLLANNLEEQIDRLLVDRDEAVAVRTLGFLAQRGRPQDVPRIAPLLSSPSANVQSVAAQALAEVGDQSAVPIFRKALQATNPNVRASACRFLCRFRDTQSIAAIGKAMDGIDSRQRASIITGLPRMESRDVVALLIEQLDERLDTNTRPSSGPYWASLAAAQALRTLTSIEFPLNTAQARLRWDEFKAYPDEVLLRKAILEDIEALTSPDDYEVRWNAYERLGRLTNQHFGSYGAFHNREDFTARAQSQELWRHWAKENLTRSRIDWIYAGFAESGIDLARPMDAKGIDTLIEVMDFYCDVQKTQQAETRRPWSLEGGWVKGHFHQHNAGWLLERLTGHQTGLSPYYHVLPSGQSIVESQRWAAWWKENRDKIKLHDLPNEKPVTAERLAAVPTLTLPPAPLKLTVHQPQITVKNISTEDVTVERRPSTIDYLTGSAAGTGPVTGAGTMVAGGREGAFKEDFVTLKPGETIAWEQKDLPANGVRYELVYWFAGSPFGLNAWRGSLWCDRE